MALITLANLKTNLSISSSAEDTLLSALIRQASAALKTYLGRNIGDEISANSVAAATVVTSLGHGLETGDTIVIYGSNSTPTIDGSRVVTRVSDDTFTVPVTVTVAGTAGFFARQFTEYLSGKSTPETFLRQTPVQSISAAYEDADGYWGTSSDPFPAATLLTAGEDYALVPDGDANGTSRTGTLQRLGAVWGGSHRSSGGLLVASPSHGLGNIKVTYIGGYRRIPGDIQLACMNMVSTIKSALAAGGPMQSESLDYYSYTRMDPALEAKALGSVRQLLGAYKKWVL